MDYERQFDTVIDLLISIKQLLENEVKRREMEEMKREEARALFETRREMIKKLRRYKELEE